jgi:hypothetical protein
MAVIAADRANTLPGRGTGRSLRASAQRAESAAAEAVAHHRSA